MCGYIYSIILLFFFDTLYFFLFSLSPNFYQPILSNFPYNTNNTLLIVNATAANGVDTSRLAQQVPLLKRVILATPELEWIIQKNTETIPLWSGLCAQDPPPNMSVLNDASMGLGVAITTFEDPPSIHDAPRGCGYAGGIGPENVMQMLTAVAKVAQGTPVWIDMESSLRTVRSGEGVDIFDLEKCAAVAKQTLLLMRS